jgi:predicted DsbA family dithiol-disulfide isomerase
MMQIDVIFDTVCPWCFVGKRRLETALARAGEDEVLISWRPFLLNPDMPVEGVDKDTYFRAKFGGRARSQRVSRAIAEAGKSVGVEFDFDLMRRIPNSVSSHRLVKYAEREGRAGDAVEALYRAYFLEGRDIGNISTLLRVGEEIGFKATALRNYLHGPENAESIRDDNARAHRMGVTGVPAYIIDGRFAVSGAQEPEVFLRLFEVARAKRHEDLAAAPQSMVE